MKTFTFRYEEKPLKKAFARMRKVAETNVPDIRDDELVCDSLESMLDVMSKSRFQTFAAIVEHKPNSLYELAKVIEKDQAQVLRETRALESLGLVKLETVQDGGREKLKPIAVYDRVIFKFHSKNAAIGDGMTWQISKFMDVGTANPIVARLGAGLNEVIQMTSLPKEKKELINAGCFEIMKSLVEAEKAAKPLMEEIRAAEKTLLTEGVKLQGGGKAIETPGVMALDNSRVFLKYAKSGLQQLAEVMGTILDKDFKGPHFHKILGEAKKKFGASHVVCRLLEEDQNWIKELLDLRNEEEHPKSKKAFVQGFNIRPVGDKFYVTPPSFFNGLPVLNRLEVYSHNLLTFAEELIAHSMETFFPEMVLLYSIPEEQRNPAMPIRYRLGFKEKLRSGGKQ